MNLGHGYRTDWKHYRLFVEVGPEGWEARIYDLTDSKWGWRETVDAPEDGKSLAVQKLAEAEGVGDSEIANAVRWTEY